MLTALALLVVAASLGACGDQAVPSATPACAASACSGPTCASTHGAQLDPGLCAIDPDPPAR